MNIRCTICGADLSNRPWLMQKHIDGHKSQSAHDAVREAERRGYLRGLRAAQDAVMQADSSENWDMIERLITEAEGGAKATDPKASRSE